MAKFSKEHQPNADKRGRPTGSPNKQKSEFRKGGRKLLDNLMERALNNDDEAAKLVLPFIAKPKPYTEICSIDGQLLQAKIKVITELEERLEALEMASEK